MNEDTTELKKAINNLIWMYSPQMITIYKAEQIAIDILAMIQSGYDIQEVQVSRITRL
jgi:hypothetical protein